MRFRLSDNRSWAHEFEADEEAFQAAFVAALNASAGRLVSLHQWGNPAFTDHGWFNVGNVQMGVYYDGRPDGKRMDTHPGHREVHGYGHHFLAVSPDIPCAAVVWGMAHNSAREELPLIDCRRQLTAAQQHLQDLYSDLVSRARNYRRLIAFRSPRLPVQRAASEEAQFGDRLIDIGREYHAAALAYRPDTDWAAWEQYVRRQLHLEVAEIVIASVVAA
jgi:hypothetical protein